MRLSSFVPAAALATLFAITPALSSATVIYTAVSPALTTPDNLVGGNTNGTGVWFNPLNGYAEVRDSFPTVLFEDGKFFLLRDASFVAPEAEIFTEGFFSRGNGVVLSSSSNQNPARFAAGAVIGPGVGYVSPTGGFADLGPTFGNWTTGGRGFLGLVLRDPSGAASTDVFYGFADITVNADFSITLNAFAYNNVRGQAITAISQPVPEPSTLAFLGLGLGVVGLRALSSRRTTRRPS